MWVNFPIFLVVIVIMVVINDCCSPPLPPFTGRTIQRSELFYCHPHLLRQLGVHTILLDLMRTYLGISSKSSIEEALLTSRRKRRLNAHLDSSAPPPVADCCQFLCNFARISQANQRALFCYLTMFLDHVDEYPGTCIYCVCVYMYKNGHY